MCRHVMMRFDMIFKPVRTCHNAFDAIWCNSQTRPDVSYSLWCNLMRFLNMSRHVIMLKDLSRLVLMNTWQNKLKMSQIWANGIRSLLNKAIPWTTSTSERSKTREIVIIRKSLIRLDKTIAHYCYTEEERSLKFFFFISH